MIKNKLITARKERNRTQNDMAEFLCISQSQYHRREQGEVRISEDEWTRMANFLDKKIEDIREEDMITAIYNYDNHSGNYSASNNYFYNIPEFMMKNQQEFIELLKLKIKQLEEELEKLKKGQDAV
ncbi:MAG: helix-turn-helix transcriptional regulator [Dysgonamonadaceae bacterium]|jgi:transcriptional regulator with XRE-family HTH domain|nr:helix-turn-helix transcriptional regulator [Dysgonamonadaceae bacterium]